MSLEEYENFGSTFSINNKRCYTLWSNFVFAVLFGNYTFIYYKRYSCSGEFRNIFFFRNRNGMLHCARTPNSVTFRSINAH